MTFSWPQKPDKQLSDQEGTWRFFRAHEVSQAEIGKLSVGVNICMSLISQLQNLRYLSHLKTKSPSSLKVELEHDRTLQHLFFDYGKWDEAESGFVSQSPDNSISNIQKLLFFCIKDPESQ